MVQRKGKKPPRKRAAPKTVARRKSRASKTPSRMAARKKAAPKKAAPTKTRSNNATTRSDRLGEKLQMQSGQMAGYGSQLQEAGYAVIADMVDGAKLREIAQFASGLICDRAGTRRLIELAWCRELAVQLMHDERLSGILSTQVIPVQCALFVKSNESNWLVSLHQDLSIPVAERVESRECQGWSEKEGELFVQPPVSVLDTLLVLRLHLDACNERNGALRVVPGSHRLGRLTTAEAIRAKEERGEVCVEVPRGGAMLMKPLLLHASSKVSVDGVRRVLHFVFAPTELPGALRWPPRGRSHASMS